MTAVMVIEEWPSISWMPLQGGTGRVGFMCGRQLKGEVWERGRRFRRCGY